MFRYELMDVPSAYHFSLICSAIDMKIVYAFHLAVVSPHDFSDMIGLEKRYENVS